MKKIISVFLVILLAFNITAVTYAIMPGYVQSVEINADENITMYVGDELTLEATATPVGFDYSYMLWTTSDPSVINLIGDDGTTEFEPPTSTATITALSEGTAIITVYAALELPETEDYTTHDFVTINVLPKESTSSLREFSTTSYNNENEIVRHLSCAIESLNDDIVLDMENMSIAPEQSLYDSEYDLLVLLDLKTTDENNPYPQIEETAVNLGVSILGGGTSHHLGKNYKAFLILGDNKQEISVTEIDDYNISFNIRELGKYVIYFDEYDEYVVNFYNEIPPENSEESDYIYHKIENLQASDIVVFPEIPEKENYVFTGWKVQSGNGIYFAEPQPFTALNNNGKYYASWCLETEYEPIKIEISSSETITKGKENGKKIILKTNYGRFVEDTEFPTDWRTAYNSETDEQTKADILSEWKSKWNIIGNDDLIIETATRIDDKTVEFTLSGNSDDIYANSDIYIEFDNSLLMPEPYETNGEIIDWDDTKIKMDTDGVRAKMYCSDNALALSRQSRPSTGGGGGVSRYTVTFDTNGGNSISKQTVNRNATVKEPEQPQKDEYNFIGWFTDKELTKQFDFSTKITKSITLYAKWAEIDKTKRQIILTIGDKNAKVFGENKANDVAPKIVNDRTMLPARFVAESLGAKVEWDETAPGIVTITKDDVKIVIYIGEEYAVVNGEKVKLDSPAFIENDRTYTPIRFISEELGAKVEWLPETQQVVITK